MTESEIQRAIVEALDRIGVVAVRVQSGKASVRGGWLSLAPPGTPDLVLVAPPGWLECKSPKGLVSPAQRRWHRLARASGARVAVVRSPREALEVVQGWRQEDEATAALRRELEALDRVGLA